MPKSFSFTFNVKSEEIHNEEVCAQRLRLGDEHAFRYVMNRYFLVINQFTKRIIKNTAAAEDVAVETFTKLWKHHHNVTSFESIQAFLYITAKNGCLNELRNARNLERRHINYTLIQEGDKGPSLSNEIILTEVKAEIYRMAEHLPEKIRRVFDLAYVEGLPNREIALKLSVSVNTVKSQKIRAIQLLKEKVPYKDAMPYLLLLGFFLEK